jgi:hypothetical protein
VVVNARGVTGAEASQVDIFRAKVRLPRGKMWSQGKLDKDGEQCIMTNRELTGITSSSPPDLSAHPSFGQRDDPSIVSSNRLISINQLRNP